MINRKRVRIGLEYCANGCNLNECPYLNEGCNFQLMHDALAVLKELGPVESEEKIVNGEIVEVCGNCQAILNGEPCYCPFCGCEVER